MSAENFNLQSLGGHFGPEKKIYPPPPKFRADTLPAPRPPLLGFPIRNRPLPHPFCRFGPPSPPRSRKVKISATSTKEPSSSLNHQWMALTSSLHYHQSLHSPNAIIPAQPTVLQARYFQTPVTVTPQQEISKTLNSSKIPLKILNVYFWG